MREMQLGLIGLGNMGRPMAANLMTAGYSLTIHDIRREAAEELVGRGAVWAASPRAVAEAGSVTITALPGPAESESAFFGVNGILEGARPGDHFIDVSTSTPASIRRIAAAAAAKNVHVLDAPVSGGVRGARNA